MIDIDLSTLEAETRCPVCLGEPPCLPVSSQQSTCHERFLLCLASIDHCVSCHAAARAGVVKSCRLVSGCMHRFCADCIEKWLRVARHAPAPVTCISSPHEQQKQSLPADSPRLALLGLQEAGVHAPCLGMLRACGGS